MDVCSICCITNMAAGMEDAELSHKEVKQRADESSEQFTLLVSTLLEEMPG